MSTTRVSISLALSLAVADRVFPISWNPTTYNWCRWWDSNPHDCLRSQDFKSCASAISPHRQSPMAAGGIFADVGSRRKAGMEAAFFLSRSFLIVIVIVLPLLPKEITITIEAKKGRKRLIRRLRLRPRKRGISQLQAGRYLKGC